MLNFQKIIIIIAVILLIISLVLIGIFMNNNKTAEQWPPLIGDCPDYWIDTSGNGSKCVNVKNLGKCKSSSDPGTFSMDFTTSEFTGSQGLCNKYKWATSTCGVSWDGITYGVENPCPQPPPPLSDGAIAGIVISVLFVTCLIIFAIYYYFFRDAVDLRKAVSEIFGKATSAVSYIFGNVASAVIFLVMSPAERRVHANSLLTSNL